MLEPETWLDMPLILEGCFEVVRKASESVRGLHAHGGFQIDYLLEGELSFDIEEKHTLDLHGGQFLLIPPHVRHRIRHDVVPPCTLFWIRFDPLRKYACRNTPFTKEFLKWTARRLLAVGATTRRVDKDFAYTFNRLDSLLKSTRVVTPDRLAAHDIRLLLCQLWLLTVRLLGPEENHRPSPIIEKARRFMEENIGVETDISGMGKHLGISRGHLTRVFLQETGYTPGGYLRRLRCARAKEMLVTTSFSMTRIAMSLGFSSSQRFAEVFKKYTGMSPSQCRKGTQD